MSSLATICADKMDAIPRWQFWRRWEREFWFGGILAEYAKYTGNKEMCAKAETIFDKYSDRILAKSAPQPTSRGNTE